MSRPKRNWPSVWIIDPNEGLGVAEDDAVYIYIAWAGTESTCVRQQARRGPFTSTDSVKSQSGPGQSCPCSP
jgi:hypothetical protein